MMVKRPSLAERMKTVQTAPAASTPATKAAPPAATPAVSSQPKAYHAATREGMKRVTAVLPPEDHRRLKRLSADTGRSIEELLREAIAELFTRHDA